MNSKFNAVNYAKLMIILFILQGCIVIPKTVPEKNQACLLVTKSLTIDSYTSSEMIDEAKDEMVHALASDCHEPECLIGIAPLVAISAGSLVVSGSIVVVGNTIHWIEKQGKVVSVTDGDTMKILSNGKQAKVRVAAIECSEKGQPWGEEVNINRLIVQV